MRKISLKKLAKLGGVMPRSSITSPRRPIKAKKRSASEFARIYGSRGRVMWVKSLPCVVCGYASTGPCENAHIQTGGMGRKADAALIVPLCSPHHQSLHKRGVVEFCDRYRVDLHAAAARTESAWLASLPPLEASPK